MGMVVAVKVVDGSIVAIYDRSVYARHIQARYRSVAPVVRVGFPLLCASLLLACDAPKTPFLWSTEFLFLVLFLPT